MVAIRVTASAGNAAGLDSGREEEPEGKYNYFPSNR